MRILFLGAGAVGGYFGGRMTAAGSDVTFLVRPGRAAQLADGLRIESPLGDAVVPVRTILADEVAGSFDVVVLAAKAYGLPGAMEAIAPHVGRGTAIVPLLNGFAHLSALDERFPEATVLGGVAQIPAELRPDGTVLHRGKLAAMLVGPRGTGAETAEAFVGVAEAAGIKATLSDRITQDLWDKWVFLATLAAATCLMRTDVGGIIRTTHGETVMRALLAECTAVAEAEGHRPDAERMAYYTNQLTARDGTFKASMLVDLEAGNPTEADHILGDMIRRAEQHGLATPYLEVALTHLHVYEAARIA